jgi:hypothetical protein
LSEDLFEKLNGQFFLQRQFAYLQDRSAQFPGDAEINQGAESYSLRLERFILY